MRLSMIRRSNHVRQASCIHSVLLQFSTSVRSVRLCAGSCVHSVLLRVLSRIRHDLLRVLGQASAPHLHPVNDSLIRKALVRASVVSSQSCVAAALIARVESCSLCVP